MRKKTLEVIKIVSKMKMTGSRILFTLKKTEIMVIKRPSSQNRGTLISTRLNISKYLEKRIVQIKDSISRYCFQQFKVNILLTIAYIINASVHTVCACHFKVYFREYLIVTI